MGYAKYWFHGGEINVQTTFYIANSNIHSTTLMPQLGYKFMLLSSVEKKKIK